MSSTPPQQDKQLFPIAGEGRFDLRVGRYTINCSVVQGQKIQTKITPEPASKKEAHDVVDALCVQLVQVNLEISRKDLAICQLQDENGRLKDDLLREKDQLNQVVAILKQELENLKQQYTDVNERLETLQNELDDSKTSCEKVTQKLDATETELKGTIGKLQDQLDQSNTDLKNTKATLERHQRMYAYAGIGSWIENARFQILSKMNLYENLTTQNQSQKWNEMCIRLKEDKQLEALFMKVLKELFGLEPNEWIVASVNFYRNRRNAIVHYRPSVEEAIEMLDSLPPPFDSKSYIFRSIIEKSAAMMSENAEENL